VPSDKEKIRIIARNRKARHEYEIISSLEAGIELRGGEVKSLREGKVNLADAYASVENGEVFLKHLHISPYKMAAGETVDPARTRRLLVHKRQIHKLAVKTEQQGMTLVPLTVYFKGKHAKIELALVTGRKKYDKRQAIARKEADRSIRQATAKDKDR
jgi:SsrA-binding protein